MQGTCHSEVFPLVSVVLSPVAAAFHSQEKIDSQWQDLNYIASPSYSRAIKEYAGFEGLLREQGISCLYLPTTPELTLDSLYCRDASIATDHGMIICRMGKAQRMGEPSVHEAFYRARGLPVLGCIEAPGTLEGGDVAWLDGSTLAVAHSYRTNKEGISQLIALLSPFDINVLVAPLPHYLGPGDVFHLMSVISPVAEKMAVVYSPLLPIAFRNHLLSREISLIEVPEQEFLSMGCNVLAISPQTCVMVSGNPITAAALKDEGLEVITYPGREISIKGGGGPTCLTRPLERHKKV